MPHLIYMRIQQNAIKESCSDMINKMEKEEVVREESRPDEITTGTSKIYRNRVKKTAVLCNLQKRSRKRRG